MENTTAKRSLIFWLAIGMVSLVVLAAHYNNLPEDYWAPMTTHEIQISDEFIKNLQYCEINPPNA